MNTKPIRFTLFRDSNGTVYISEHEESTTFSEYYNCFSDKDVADAVQDYMREIQSKKDES